MHDFTDATGRLWTLTIHVPAFKRVRAALHVDLYTLCDNRLEGLAKLLADAVEFVDVLYVLCREQCEQRGVSDEEFGRALYGDTLDRAQVAFAEELVDFFPDPRRRETLRAVLTASRALQERILTQTMKQVEAIDLNSLLESVNGSSTDSPAPSESVPTDSPGTS